MSDTNRTVADDLAATYCPRHHASRCDVPGCVNARRDEPPIPEHVVSLMARPEGTTDTPAVAALPEPEPDDGEAAA